MIGVLMINLIFHINISPWLGTAHTNRGNPFSARKETSLRFKICYYSSCSITNNTLDSTKCYHWYPVAFTITCYITRNIWQSCAVILQASQGTRKSKGWCAKVKGQCMASPLICVGGSALSAYISVYLISCPFSQRSPRQLTAII